MLRSELCRSLVTFGGGSGSGRDRDLALELLLERRGELVPAS
jgi:hypothetical protein